MSSAHHAAPGGDVLNNTYLPDAREGKTKTKKNKIMAGKDLLQIASDPEEISP